MANYTVEQGDYVSKIAQKFGFRDYQTIWNDPQNADLKKKRQNPNILFPGDIVYIPERKPNESSAATDKRHRFQTNIKPLMLRFELRHWNNKPMTGVECELDVEGTVYSLTTDGKGRIEQEIPPEAENGKLRVKHPTAPSPEIPLKIGYIDPIDEVTGWKGRLNNLGYNAGAVDAEETQQLRSAIEEFQCDFFKNRSQVDGKCGSKTQTKLKEVYGC
jgi:hypothetical protein